MKTILLKHYFLLLVIINVTAAFSQDSPQVYSNDLNYIKTKNDYIEFKIQSVSPNVDINYCGCGNYIIYKISDEKFLSIDCGVYSLNKTRFESTAKRNNISEIKIMDTKGILVKNPILVISNTTSEGNNILGSMIRPDEQGILKMPADQEDCKIYVGAVGYDFMEIDFNKGSDYNVYLANCQILENRTVVFKINSWDDQICDVTLLSTSLNQKTNRILELLRLKSEAEFNNVQNEIFKRDYSPDI